MQYIYLIINKNNNKFYVGRTKDYQARWNHHKRLLQTSKHHCIYLQNAWNKYGQECFDFVILEEIDLNDELLEYNKAVALEQEILDEYVCGVDIYNTSSYSVTGVVKGEDHPNYGLHPRDWLGDKVYQKVQKNFLNKDKTGKNNPFYEKTHTEETRKLLSELASLNNVGAGNPFYGRKHTDETKRKISEKAKVNNKGEKNPFYGKKHSEAAKKAISEANKGKLKGIPKSEKTREKMRQNSKSSIAVEIDGIIYRSFTEAQRQLGIDRKAIAKKARSDDPKYDNFKILRQQQQQKV